MTLKSGTNDFKGSGFFFGNTESTNASDYAWGRRRAPAFEGADQIRAGWIHAWRAHRAQQVLLLRRLPADDRQPRVCRARDDSDDGDAKRRLQRRRQLASTTRSTGAVNGTGRTAFANNQIPQDRISPIARRLIALIPEPNIAGAPLGQNNYQKAQVREKTTDAFDTKVNYSLSEKNQLSYRLSFQRPVVFDPGLFGEFGGPANGGFAGTGTNTSISTAANWTRVFSPTMVMDVRGGVNYYHNVDLRQKATG